MTERTIAELIGWERADDNDVAPTWWDAAGYLHDRWTTDDLLAWLREQDVYLRPYTDDLTDVPVRLGVGRYSFATLDMAVDEAVSAPTLLAALEAAVRAVAS
jgi:hypothetical protein